MEIWEVLRLALSIVGGLAGVAAAVIGTLYKQTRSDLKAEVQERKIEFASLRGRMETMSDEREVGDAKIHARLNDLEKRLPQEYARQGTIESIERRIGSIESEMKSGFRHTDIQLQKIIEMVNGK